MNIKKTLMGGALLAFAAAAPALAEQGVTDTEVVIGNILPISSSAGLPARGALHGTMIAAREANDAGGVNGRQIVIRTEDDGYVPARTVQSMRKLIDEGVFGMIGTSGGAGTAAILPILEDDSIPTIVSFSPLAAAVDPVKPSVFMIGASYQDLLFAQLNYIHENSLPEDAKIGIIRQDDDFGKQTEEAFHRAVEEFGLNAVTPITYKRGQKDFSAEVLKIRSSGVNVLVSGGSTIETPAILKAASKFKMPLQVASVPTSMLVPIMGLGADTGYSYFSGDYLSPLGSDGTAHFESLAAKYLSADEMKDMNRYSLSAYAATRMMIEAIALCGDAVTRACVSEKLASGHAFENDGVTPALSFSAGNHIAATAVRVMSVDPAKSEITAVTEFTNY